jgi:hypothetical protein
MRKQSILVFMNLPSVLSLSGCAALPQPEDRLADVFTPRQISTGTSRG